MEDNEFRFLDWFAGFVAGEGCFRLRGTSNNRHWRADFAIALREDDLPILLEIQERLQMGKITRTERQLPDKPMTMWCVHRIDDCVRLVKVFEAHPVRAKKQADFEIWKQAVAIISNGRSRAGSAPATYDRGKLKYLHDRIRFTRTYHSSEEKIFGPSDEEDNSQLTIWGEDEETEE